LAASAAAPAQAATEAGAETSDRAWQLDARDWQLYKLYNQVIPIAEQLIRETSTGEVPWDIIESTDWRYRNLTLYTILLERLTRRLTLPQVTGPRERSVSVPDA
jgi:polyphosphate kinase 2 (PPK2 family)